MKLNYIILLVPGSLLRLPVKRRGVTRDLVAPASGRDCREELVMLRPRGWRGHKAEGQLSGLQVGDV